MIKKGIDLVRLSPHRMLHRVPWQDPAMACDACSLAGRKRCVVCKFRSATMQELRESCGRVYARKDEEQL
jgi:hypothetical protein